MTHFEITSIVLSVIAVILIPTLILMVRGAVKWTRTEDRLAELVTDVHELVEQAREDRIAADRRLRFIEEWFMGRRPRRS